MSVESSFASVCGTQYEKPAHVQSVGIQQLLARRVTVCVRPARYVSGTVNKTITITLLTCSTRSAMTTISWNASFCLSSTRGFHRSDESMLDYEGLENKLEL